MALALAFAAALASAAQAAPSLPIPAAGDVDRIVVSVHSGEAVITDPRVIDEFVAFLKARNRHWSRPWGTFPTPEWTIRLIGRKDPVLVLWLGPNWLGGREGLAGAQANRLRSLSEKDRAEALRILGATAQ